MDFTDGFTNCAGINRTSWPCCLKARPRKCAPEQASKPINEVWLNPGFYSYHWQRDQGLNGDNYGFGGEYRFSTVLSATAGEFYNSDRDHSKYLGVYYQPISIGPVRFGAALGGFDGYPKMRDGGWFLAAIPVASYEYERVGLNLSFVPSYKDRLYGALTFQVKLKVF